VLLPTILGRENFRNAHRNVQKSSKVFKLSLHNVASTGTNIAKPAFSCTLRAV